MGIATTPQKSVGSPSTGAKDTHTMKGRKGPVRARRCVSAVARPSLVRPCPMKTKPSTQSSMRKLVLLLIAKKRRISTSLRLCPSHLIATRAMIEIETPGSSTPPMKT
eukprot:11742460-Ditylum_brightwellii.AAC.1